MPAEHGTLHARTEGGKEYDTPMADALLPSDARPGSTIGQGLAPRQRATFYQRARHAGRAGHPFGAGPGLRLRLTLIYVAILALMLLLPALLADPLAQIPALHTPLALVLGYLLLLLLGGALCLLATTLVLRPLHELTTVAQALARGDLAQRAALPTGHGELARLGQSFQTLAEQVERATARQRADEARVQQLISRASHELRTPLTSIRGLSEVLLRGPIENPELLQRVLRIIKSESERMTRLINDMLVLVRLEEGRALQLGEVDLLELAVDCIEQARVFAGEQGPRIQLELATQERLLVQGDMDRLRQALFALLENAVRYGRPLPEGQVLVRLDRQGDYGLIQVIDNGPGIAPEDLPYIFERFYRGRHLPPGRADGTSVPGAGLGLAIARAVARAHHGDVNVTSEREQGATFTLSLPCPRIPPALETPTAG
jgi:signal transduction histidine kinase